MITLDDFTKMVETPLKWTDGKNCSKSFIMGIITRTMRLTLNAPEIAREYYNNQPMATMDAVEPSKKRGGSNGRAI